MASSDQGTCTASNRARERQARILLLTPAFPPATGGIERTAAALAGGLSGFQLEVVAGRSPSVVGMRPPQGVSVHWAANDPPGGRRATFALTRLAIRTGLRFRPDLVLSLHIRSMPAARAIARVTDARIVLVLHAKEMREQPGLARAAVRWADALVTVSGFSSELALEAGADPERLTVIHPGVSLPAGVPLPLAQRPGPPTIITVSRLSDPNKGHDIALEAMALLREARPDARWTIVGDGTLRPGLERRVQELGLTTSVSFLGSLDDAALTDALHSAHVFCLLSRPAPEGAAGEGFGIVFIEAGAHGLPVVAGRTPGVVDAVRQGRSGLLVDPTDPRAAADAIVRVLGDAELSDRLSAGGRARAAELEWPHVVRRYATLITKTLEEPSVGTGTRYPRWLRDVLFGPR